MEEEYKVRPEVITHEDVISVVPKLKGHDKLIDALFRFLIIDKVNDVHSRWCHNTGPEFVKNLVEDEFKIRVHVDNEQTLEHLPEGAFITISNHCFGAWDGVISIYLLTRHRPKYKMMVNMILNQLSAMRPNFIAVDAWQTNDPEKKKVSIDGIRKTLKQLRDGEPVGFFPAGAISKVNWKYEQVDRPWQPTVIQIIEKAKVPIVPMFFHGGNSFFSNLLGHVCWQARSLWLPHEMFRRANTDFYVSVGDIISVEQWKQHAGSIQELSDYLRSEVYALKKRYPH